MPGSDFLSVLEQQVMFAIQWQHPNAYGVSIREKIFERTGKQHSLGSIYAVLERLENKGYVESREGEITKERGGRKKLYFTSTGLGQIALKTSLNAVDTMRLIIGMEGAEA